MAQSHFCFLLPMKNGREPKAEVANHYEPVQSVTQPPGSYRFVVWPQTEMNRKEAVHAQQPIPTNIAERTRQQTAALPYALFLPFAFVENQTV